MLFADHLGWADVSVLFDYPDFVGETLLLNPNLMPGRIDRIVEQVRENIKEFASACRRGT